MKAAFALLPLAAIGVVSLGLAGIGQEIKVKGIASASPKRADKVVLSDAQWKKRLTKEQYTILRDKGTEPAFCGVNLHNKGDGIYSCAGCGLALFRTDGKFDSGTGWPSFFRPISADRIWIESDKKYGMVRSEVLCARCDGHLGHVFDDGPKPTGLRYCMNGKVLRFTKDAK